MIRHVSFQILRSGLAQTNVYRPIAQMVTPDLTLLMPHDPAPYILHKATKDIPLLLVCDHAGRRIPESLGRLGLSDAEMARHIAWDIGIAEVARRLHKNLGATLIEQVYSRLVIDCNRAPRHPTSIPETSDGTMIKGNERLDEMARARREEEIFKPYHACIHETLENDPVAHAALISLHSFTPIWQRQPRRWDAGVLFHRDRTSADIMHELLEQKGFVVGVNEPYRMTATSDYTIPHHAEGRGVPYLELEIRQDLIADEAGQNHWAIVLSDLLPIYWQAWSQFDPRKRAYI